MTRTYDTVSFLSDYGRTDEFVGVVTSVIRGIAPGALVIDLTHDIPAHDVRAGSLALARAVPYVASGIVLAVVDPGVGTSRRAIAVEVAAGEGVFVGPDNGLLAAAVALTGGAERAVTLTNPEYQLVAPGPTFAGRDVFAPAAAHLCAGVDLAELGEQIDPVSLVPGMVPIARDENGGITAEVLWIDRYGNVQLNVDGEEAAGLGATLRIRYGEAGRVVRVVPTYADVAPGDVGAVVDSHGLLSLVCDRSSAAEALGLHPGDVVALSTAFDVEAV
ncbi:MAG TPA: SAM-dependent chlorinase/fluorinase [Acidimicrobiales bacterium]|nr:SAM-dependent chlorinase/fluorinase [Acidimicrobiales bacterium]